MSNSREVTATIVGALIGGAAGYLFFTERGRELRLQIEPALEDIAREVTSLRSSLQTAGGVARDGWSALNEVIEHAS